jgi:hypothetical protein
MSISWYIVVAALTECGSVTGMMGLLSACLMMDTLNRPTKEFVRPPRRLAFAMRRASARGADRPLEVTPPCGLTRVFGARGLSDSDWLVVAIVTGVRTIAGWIARQVWTHHRCPRR